MEYIPLNTLRDTSNSEIVALCLRAPCLSSDSNSTKVVKITPDIVVKFGIGVHQSEATTLNYVICHVDRSILRVPRVYRFFTHGDFAGMPLGYIVMEFVGGATLEACNITSELIKRIVTAINHISTLPMPQLQGPGPVYGGIPQGCLWTEYGAGTTFTSSRDMENWLNQRLDLSRNQTSRFSLSSESLVFSHMDIAKRNIILTETNEIVLIDWAHAGFYPAYFQRFCIEWCSVDDASFTKSLLHHLPGSYSNNEQYLLGEVLRINAMYHPSDLSRNGKKSRE